MTILTKYLIIAGVIAAVAASVFGYLAKIKYDAAQAEREKIRIALIAATNQKIAEKRVLDVKFNKMDAETFCRDAGLTWVFDNQRSHCE